MTHYEWTTERGVHIELDVEERVITETRDADGDEYQATRREVAILAAKVNEQAVSNPRWGIGGSIDCQVGERKARIMVPEQIAAQIWAKERAALARRLAEEARYEADRRRIQEAMRE